jgi:KaiC/GvpD/RAD55 family RecA-like ATPase
MTAANSLPPLRFGIPTLDELIGVEVKPSVPNPPGINDFGIGVGTGNASICIMGPDGSGKSILGLHLASRYAADCCEQNAKVQVLYVSTDLLADKAEQIWNQGFALNIPHKRAVPHAIFSPQNHFKFFKPTRMVVRTKKRKNSLNPYSGTANIEIKRVMPEKIDEHLENPSTQSTQGAVKFLDLAANTAGDDWGFLNRILAALPPLEGKSPKHLVIIDAVEGLEIFAGERDAFGEDRNRRSRIAQLVRTAASKCHLVFVVEEMREGQRLAEEFIADVVIRLRANDATGTLRRTIEVVKSRAQAHVPGVHDYVIRSGNPTLTGDSQDPDQSQYKNAYFHVFHNVNTLFHGIARLDKAIESRDLKLPTFGIRYLDAMIGHDLEDPETANSATTNSATTNSATTNSATTNSAPVNSTTGRFPASNITTIIGDVATYKTHLGHAFLAECFATKEYPWPTAIKSDPVSQQGPIAVLLTTHLIDAASLAERIYKCLPESDQSLLGRQATPTSQDFNNFKHRLKSQGKDDEEIKVIWYLYQSQRIICRRLPAREVTSAEFFHVVESAVREARNKMGLPPQQPSDRWQGQNEFQAIRLVIDDWSTITSMYPGVAKDPLLLQFLLQYFQWQNVAALLIDTQAGDPNTIRRSAQGSDLRGRIGRMIYTWHVPFFGEDRVAITIDPPLNSGLRASVRELRRQKGREGKLEVDPHFEYYSGLESGDPQPLSLQVLLFAGSAGPSEYFDETESLLGQFFRSVKGQPIVIKEAAQNYDQLRQLALSPRSHRLGYTQLIQVDEFWKHSDDVANQAVSDGAQFCRAYLNARTINHQGQPTIEDPFQVFQPSEATLEKDAKEWHKVTLGPVHLNTILDRRRYSFFKLSALMYLDSSLQNVDVGSKSHKKNATNQNTSPVDLRNILIPSRPLEAPLNTVPMTWDFGFLVCRRRSWMSAKDRTFKPLVGSEYSVHEVIKWLEWSSLPESAKKSVPQDMKPSIGKLLWFDFFQACRQVAQTQLRHGAKEPIYAFDLDLSSTEGMACLVFEIMASELQDILSDPAPSAPSEDIASARALFAGRYRDSRFDNNVSLLNLLANPFCQEALLRALLLLFGVTDSKQFDFEHFDHQERSAHPSAVAARHWYSTASRAMSDWEACDPFVPWRLPGYYSVRGDWFLTIAEGSQSQQLAKSALDLLSSTRANLLRMRHGIGLPTRSMLGLEHQRTKLLTIRPEPLSIDRQDLHSGETEPPRYRRLMRYEEVAALGVSKDNDMQWIWRSHLAYYQRHSRIWNRWLLNFTRNWHRRSLHPFHKDMDAFALYRDVATYNSGFERKRLNPSGTASGVSPTTQQEKHMDLACGFFRSALNRLILDLLDATPLPPKGNP